jgi:NAD(P)-dependent dehydrogenase (short-subunit alcohol dehydrogenase family)
VSSGSGLRGELLESSVDVRDINAVRAAARDVADGIGTPKAVIYAVGRPPDIDVPLLAYPSAEWSATIDTYVSGFIYSVQCFAPLMRSGGHVVALSSAITRFTTATLPPFHAGHYAAAKAALDAVCVWARRDLHERGMLLSRLAPSAVDTDYHRRAPRERRPPTVVLIERLCHRIISAIENHEEIDEVMMGDTPLSPAEP